MARPRTKSDEEIAAATLRAVGAHGVAGLTLAHVAAEAGLAASTLAERYGSKRALLLAAAKSGAGAVEKAAKAAAYGPSGFSDGGSDFGNGDSDFADAEADRAYAVAVDFLVALAGRVSDRRAFAHHLAFLELDVSDPEFGAVAREHAAAVLAALESFGLSAPEARRMYVAYNGALVVWALAGEGSLADSLRADLELSANGGR